MRRRHQVSLTAAVLFHGLYLSFSPMPSNIAGMHCSIRDSRVFDCFAEEKCRIYALCLPGVSEVNAVLSASSSVITSYSIHYTKLYDIRKRTSHVTLIVENRIKLEKNYSSKAVESDEVEVEEVVEETND